MTKYKESLIDCFKAEMEKLGYHPYSIAMTEAVEALVAASCQHQTTPSLLDAIKRHALTIMKYPGQAAKEARAIVDLIVAEQRVQDMFSSPTKLNMSEQPVEQANLDEEVLKKLKDLVKAASEVSRLGAQTGPQWVALNFALIKAKSALAKRTEGKQ